MDPKGARGRASAQGRGRSRAEPIPSPVERRQHERQRTQWLPGAIAEDVTEDRILSVTSAMVEICAKTMPRLARVARWRSSAEAQRSPRLHGTWSGDPSPNLGSTSQRSPAGPGPRREGATTPPLSRSPSTRQCRVSRVSRRLQCPHNILRCRRRRSHSGARGGAGSPFGPRAATAPRLAPACKPLCVFPLTPTAAHTPPGSTLSGKSRSGCEATGRTTRS